LICIAAHVLRIIDRRDLAGVDRQLLARLRELDMQEKKKAGKTCNDP